MIEVNQLSYDYVDGTRALDACCFSVREGESVGLIGGNGAGKSTLLMHLNGLWAPQQGRVHVCGYDATRKNLSAIRARVGMVFQDSDAQLFMPSIEEDVAFGLRNAGVAEAEVMRRSQWALAVVGMATSCKKSSMHLSGGEKRAAALATALVLEPSLILLDEPSSNLDPYARRLFIEHVRALSITKIITSHDLGLIERLCTRCLVMCQGRIIADGPTSEILRQEDLLKSARLM